MKAQSTARLTFLNPRVLIGFALYAAGLVLAFAPMSSATAGDNAAAELNPRRPAVGLAGVGRMLEVFACIFSANPET